MSGQLAPKPRLVLCPKCWQLLRESPEYDVYKCGGCGTTLQAKKRRSGAVNSEASTRETDAAPRNTLNHVSEDTQCSNGEHLVIPQENGLREKATSSSSRECSLDGNSGRGQTENGECNGEQLGQFNLSDEELETEMDIYKLSDIRVRHKVSKKGCSNELSHCENEASSQLIGEKSRENAKDKNLQLAGAEELSNGNMTIDGAREELTCALDEEDANNEKSDLAGVKPEVDITGSALEGVEELNNGKLLLEGAEDELIYGSDGEDANKERSALAGANPEVDVTASNIAGAEESNNGNLLLVGAEEELNICPLDGEDPKKDQLAEAVAKSEVDITGNLSSAKRSSTENFASVKRSSGKGTSGNHVSSNEQQMQTKNHIRHSTYRARSVGTFDTTEVINISSELSGTLGESSKSPTARSSHAYDGSISSYDAVDERFSSQHLDSFENTYPVVNGVSHGKPGEGKGHSMSYGDLETEQQSHLPNGKHHGLKDSRGNPNKIWMRTKREEFPSKMPFHRSGSQSDYESGIPSNEMHPELYCSSSYLSPNSSEDPDQEKMKLLRMIYKLQDQLNRTSSVDGETNGRFSTGVSYKGKHISAYHSHNVHEGRFYHGLDYPRCNGRCSHGINWHQRRTLSWIPYLDEATSSTRYADHSCFHCCPQEWQCSEELPPHVLFQHEELYMSHPGHKCCSSHCSYPSSPQWSMTSKFPVYGRETKYGDQRYRAPEVKSLTKRHYRPVAGGAPFVTCHNCLKLLQLPADFLLFKRVCHKLKCGACSKVLKFSLQNRSHIVSYAPNVIGPPSSDHNGQNKVSNGSNLHSTSHASYSDDYGHSVSKSSTSEGDPASSKTIHSLHGSEHDIPSVSCGTFEPITQKDKIASGGSSTSKTPVETDESAGTAKLSTELEAKLPPRSSPLHQLMGYSSPSQVIRGIHKPTLNGENNLSHSSQQD